jgi:SNF2 family DNA or RNA helicase
VRLGQKLPVKIVRFITKDTIEEEHFNLHRYDINILQE